MITTTLKGQTIVATEGETRKQVRERFEPECKRIWLTDKDFHLVPEIVDALKAAGADFSKVKMIGWEI